MGILNIVYPKIVGWSLERFVYLLKPALLPIDKYIRMLHFRYYMDHEPLMVTLFFTFMLGAGVGFYIARWLF